MEADGRGFEAHPASFRDPDGRVMLREGRIFRIFTPEGARRFEAFEKTGLPSRFTAEGRLIATEPCDVPPPLPGGRVVEHPRIPFVSHAYEWTFGMLREAGLLQLDLALESLEAGYGLKDATPYNVQFLGTRPVHIDVASFEELPDGSPWIPYSQFCRLILNPLLLTALTGTPFHPWMRGRLDGIAPEELSSLLPWTAKLRRGVFSDVALQGWLNRKLASGSLALSDATKSLRVSRDRVRGILRRLKRTLEGLRLRKVDTLWTRYEQACSIDDQALAFKDRFVERALEAAAPGMVWDLGANQGRYSVMAARRARAVVAFERDPETAELLYRRGRRDGGGKILPLVMDLLDPSPGQGWEGRERQGLADRGRADFVLCLALVHHLAIGGGLPLPRFLDWLKGAGDRGVVEFVPKDDPQCRDLLRWRKDVFPGYTVDGFEAELARRFSVVERAVLPGTSRILYAYGPP